MAWRPEPDRPQPGRAAAERRGAPRSEGRTALVAGGSAVVVLVVLGSAWGGSWELEPRDLGFSWWEGRTEEPPRQPEAELVEPPDGTGSGLDVSWLGPVVEVLTWVVASTIAAAAVAWALRWLWSRFRYRDAPRRRPVPAGGGTAVVLDEPALPVLRRGVVEAQRFLSEIDRPVDAVVAAWLALEEAAGSSGVRRTPAQTPTEFTVAVLDRTTADPAATAELLALYHRARFSRSPVGDAEVALASRCLARLAASWDAVSDHDAVAP